MSTQAVAGSRMSLGAIKAKHTDPRESATGDAMNAAIAKFLATSVTRIERVFRSIAVVRATESARQAGP